MAHTYTSLLVHVIFSTKNRLPQIHREIKPRLLGYLAGIVSEEGGQWIAGNSMPDHVHFLLAQPAAKSLAEILRVVKTNSSRWVHETWPEHRVFAWQTGYGAFSVGRSNVSAVRRYVDNQEEHHRVRTFQEEFIEFLKRHRIEYDERYIWD